MDFPYLTPEQVDEYLDIHPDHKNMGEFLNPSGCPIHTLLTHFNPGTRFSVGGSMVSVGDRLEECHRFPSWLQKFSHQLSNYDLDYPDNRGVTVEAACGLWRSAK